MADPKGATTKDSGIDKETKPVAPVPTQNSADDIRKDAVVAEDEATSKADKKKKDAVPSTPSPTQAEADDIRAVAYGEKRKRRDMKADDDGPGYKTR